LKRSQRRRTLVRRRGRKIWRVRERQMTREVMALSSPLLIMAKQGEGERRERREIEG
jgi:hypothetical protein